MIITLQQIGDSLGVKKQSVAKYIEKGLLTRNKNNKIDLDDPVNYNFLESKGADFSVFGVEKTPPKIRIETEESEKEETQPKERTGAIMQKLDLQVKLQNLKSKQAETELKTIKIEELRGKLIPRDLVERYVSDTIGAFSQALVSIPFALVDNIFSIILTEGDRKREDLISLLQDKYSKEMLKAAERGYKKFMRDLQDRIQEEEKLAKESQPRN